MFYNYYLELASIFILLLILYDYRNKMKVYKLDSRLFNILIYISLAESLVNYLSSICIAYSRVVPLLVNEIMATVFFALQAIKIYTLASFSFAYMNPKYSMKDKGFVVLSLTCLLNLVLAITSPVTHFYFYFENGQYLQGFGANIGFYFYFINILYCLVYVLINRKRLLWKDKKVACVVAATVSLGVISQYILRSTLTIGLSMSIAILYLYMTLENPNDFQDRLTLCGNEYSFKIFVDQRTNENKPFSILFLDIKEFRYINSVYGNDNGDYILQQIALFLEKTFPNSIVFRLSNDLFAVPVDIAQEDLEERATMIFQYFENPCVLPSLQEVVLFPKVAISSYPYYFHSHTELMKLKSYMFYKMRDLHEVNLIVCNEEIANKCRRESKVEQILKNALTNKKLEVHYQPIIDYTTHQVVGLEALSRLTDDKLGNISPDEFITVAENHGYIVELGFYVLDEVCQFIEYNLSQIPHSIDKIHINVSTIQFSYPFFEERVNEIFNQYHIPHNMLHFEVTENATYESPEKMKKIMNTFIDQDITFSLDDYGTGYSNISYLLQFPFDYIKFDKTMTWSYFESEEAKIIMENEFELFNKLDKKVIVEGVETKSQLEALSTLSIKYYQGYYFSSPLSKQDCIAFIKNYH